MCESVSNHIKFEKQANGTSYTFNEQKKLIKRVLLIENIVYLLHISIFPPCCTVYIDDNIMMINIVIVIGGGISGSDDDGKNNNGYEQNTQ